MISGRRCLAAVAEPAIRPAPETGTRRGARHATDRGRSRRQHPALARGGERGALTLLNEPIRPAEERGRNDDAELARGRAPVGEQARRDGCGSHDRRHVREVDARQIVRRLVIVRVQIEHAVLGQHEAVERSFLALAREEGITEY